MMDILFLNFFLSRFILPTLPLAYIIKDKRKETNTQQFLYFQRRVERSKVSLLGGGEEIPAMKKEETMKLISAEGFEFVIDKKAAMVSKTLKNMLSSLFVEFEGGFAETQHEEVRFPEISTVILEKICQYFYWSLQYARLLQSCRNIIGLEGKS